MHSVTWAAANAHCTDHGVRLCTLSELPVNKGIGCGHDDEMVWVWEPCSHGSSGEHHVTGAGDGSRMHDTILMPRFGRSGAARRR